LRRISLFGFLPQEVDRVRKKILSILEHAYLSFETSPSPGIASTMMESLHRGRYLLSPKDGYEFGRRLLFSLEPDEVTRDWNELWNYPNRSVFMSGPKDLEESIDSEIEKAYEDSIQMPVTPPQVKTSEKFAYAKPISEGPFSASYIESHHYVEDLDFHQIIFKNRVRLNVKASDFEKDRVKVAIHFGNGLLEADPGEEGLWALIESIFIEGGLGQHSAEDLEKILSGHVLGTYFYANEDSFVLQGWSTTRDFRLCCELAAAYFEDPAYREDARSDALKYFRQLEEGKLKSPDGIYASEIPHRLSGKHFAFRQPKYGEIEQWTVQDAARRFGNILQSSYVEISIVGDCSVEEVIRHVGETFGQMPLREDFPKSMERKKIIQIPEAERMNFYYHSEGSKHPTAELHLFWPGLSEDNIELYRRQLLLADILSERLLKRVRHDMGEAYSPYAHYLRSDVFPSYQWMRVEISVDPAKMASVEMVFLNEIERWLRDGITEDEFQRMIEPARNNVRDIRRQNVYWMDILSHSQRDGRSLSYARTMEEFYQNVTKEELEQVAHRVLKKDQLRCYRIFPEGCRKKGKAARGAFLRHRCH
jgi:zinc protease